MFQRTIDTLLLLSEMNRTVLSTMLLLTVALKLVPFMTAMVGK